MRFSGPESLTCCFIIKEGRKEWRKEGRKEGREGGKKGTLADTEEGELYKKLLNE